jgi:hypothetical protein
MDADDDQLVVGSGLQNDRGFVEEEIRNYSRLGGCWVRVERSMISRSDWDLGDKPAEAGTTV